MDPRGVFFDLYGTLLVFGDLQRAWGSWQVVVDRHLRAIGLTLTPEELAGRCDGFFSRPEPLPRDDGLTLFERRFRDFCAELGLTPSPTALRALADDAVGAWQRHVHRDPEAPEVLAAVRRRGPVALITNFDHPRHVHALLDEWGIRPLFDVLVISGEVGISKPDPRIFDIALRRTGLRPEEVVHVGDSADDVDGARAAGIAPVLIRRPRPDGRPIVLDYRVDGVAPPDPIRGRTVTVPSLAALLELLE